MSRIKNIVLALGLMVCCTLAQVDWINEEGLRDESFHSYPIQDYEEGSDVGQETEADSDDSTGDGGTDSDHDDDGDDDQDHDGGIHEEGSHGGHSSHYHHPSEGAFWVSVLISLFLTAVGAFCSGMTVGLMSIENMQLEVMSLSGDETEKKMAKSILAVKHDHHLFLVTLLIANAMALETLPIIIHSLMPAWAAILFSTFIVLIAAEIIPQAFCTGPKRILIAYYAAPIIQVMIKIFWILAYPMGKGLDKLLGAHQHQRIQHKDFANFLTGGAQNLKSTEKLLLTSILELRTERVPKIMVPVKDLYMLELRERLTVSKIKQIDSKDFSYILVYKGEDRSNVVGVIKVKQFALKYLKGQSKGQKYNTVEDIFEEKHDLLSVYEDTNLLEMLMLFQAKSHRFALVIGKKRKVEPGIQSIMYSKSDMIAKNNEAKILGVVFLYNIFEEIAEYNEQVTNAIAKGQAPSRLQNSVQMNQLNRPLL